MKAAFADGIAYRHQWDSVIIAENGTQMTETQTRDLSDYCVSGNVLDTRDWNITVYMGRKTEFERLTEEDAALLFEIFTGEDF